MIDLVPYQYEHVKDMAVRDIDGHIARVVMSESYLRFLESAGPGYCLLVEGKCIGAVIFACLSWPGVAEVVMLLSPEIEKHKHVLYRICSTCFDDVQRRHGLLRIECRIAELNIRNRRWAETLGFEGEGVCKAFGPNGEDFIYYARIRR